MNEPEAQYPRADSDSTVTDIPSERTPLIPKPPPSTSPQSTENLSKTHFGLLLAGIWTLSFIGSLDATIVATLVSLIGSSFEALQYSSWIGTTYLLTVCGCTSLYGRLCNIIGRRASALMAGGLFGLGTALCGVARSMPQLLFFRALAGAGGGGMAVVGNVIISDVVPLKSRGLYQGFANLLFALGGAVGAPLGGWLGDTIGWRAAFLIQSPVLLIGLILLYLKVREPPSFLESAHSNTPISQKLKRIDWAGPLTLVLSLGSLLVGLTVGEELADPGERTSWWSGRAGMWGFIGASAFFIVLFVLVEVKFAVEPVMPISMLKRRNPAFVALNNFLIAVLSFSTVYTTPLFFTAALLQSSTSAGRHLIPNSACIAIGSLFAGWYMRHTGKYWWLEVFCGLGLVGASVLLSSWTNKTPEWVLYITLIPNGFGFASILTTTLLALFASVPREQIPIATGISYLFRTTGQVLGVALSSTLLQTLVAKNLRARITDDEVEGAAEIISKILDSTEYMHTLPPLLRQKATESWALALRVVFQVQIVVAILLLLTLLPIKEYPLPDTVNGPPPKQHGNGDVERETAVDEEAQTAEEEGVSGGGGSGERREQ